MGADWSASTSSAILHGRLTNLGNVEQVEVGFQYRLKKDGTDLSEKIEPWIDLPLSPRAFIGEFSFELKNLTPNRDYEYRARVRHPLLLMYGQERTFHASR
jgi:alpha-L-fucosidase